MTCWMITQMGQGGGQWGDGKKWSDSGNNLKIKPIGFAARLDVGCERQRSYEWLIGCCQSIPQSTERKRF